MSSQVCVLLKNVSEGCRLCADVSVCAAQSRNPQYDCVGCADISLVLEGA